MLGEETETLKMETPEEEVERRKFKQTPNSESFRKQAAQRRIKNESVTNNIGEVDS